MSGTSNCRLITDFFTSKVTICISDDLNSNTVVQVDARKTENENQHPLHPFFGKREKLVNPLERTSCTFSVNAPHFPSFLGTQPSKKLENSPFEHEIIEYTGTPGIESMPMNVDLYSKINLEDRAYFMDPVKPQADQYNRILNDILALVEEPNPEMEELFMPIKRLHSCNSAEPIVLFVDGPSGCGKSQIGLDIATRLNVQYLEINSAVSNRNGKPFDDILSGSKCQKDLLRRLLHEEDSVKNQAQKINMVVFIDGVDCVFPQDRFYGALNNFLRCAPIKSLILLTSNQNANVMQRFIEFPAGTKYLSFPENPLVASKLHQTVKSLKEVINLSDIVLFDQELYESIEYEVEEVPSAFISTDLVLRDENQLLSEIRKLSFSAKVNTLPERSSIRVLRSAQQAGFLKYCWGSTEWHLDYRPIWKLIEADTLERHESRVRRACVTTKHHRKRLYLNGVAPDLVDTLLRS